MRTNDALEADLWFPNQLSLEYLNKSLLFPASQFCYQWTLLSPIMARFRILIIGNGGREHALAWKLRQSPRVDHIYVAPGNGGTANCGTANGLASVTNVQDPKADDYPALVAFAKKHGVNLVVPGPEAPLVDGIATFFRNGT